MNRDQETLERLRSQGIKVQTVGDLLGDTHEAPPLATPFYPPIPEAGAPFPDPGLYFGMPEETYHAIHAASTSGLKRLAVSSMDYWADSVLNPDRDDGPQKDYFDFGKAIHCVVLEGPECYAQRYVIGLEKPDGVLETTDQIKAAIGEAGGKPITRIADGSRAAKKEDWIDQLLELDPDAQVWERLKAAFDAEHEGASIISHKINRRVSIAARMILAQPDIAENFRNGHAEVSVFWFCRETGCPMKARFDYLTMKRIVDLKSFSSRGGLPIDRAIERAIANMRYIVQQVVYDEAAAAAKDMIREHGASAVRQEVHLHDPDIIQWALKWAQTPEPEFMFVFQQSGLAPVTRGKIMPRENMGHFGVTRRRVEELKRVFIANCEVYGATEPWLDIRPVEHIDDSEIPVWASEI